MICKSRLLRLLGLQQYFKRYRNLANHYHINSDLALMMYHTPLHRAVAVRSRQEVLEELLKHGVDVNAAGSDGITPLHQAVLSKRDVGIIRELLHHGARVNATCNGGNTPLDLAARIPSGVSIIKELLQHGAIISSVDSIKCSKLLKSTLTSVSSAQLLIKTTLIRQFKEDPFDLFNLVPYQKLLLIYDVLSSYIEDCVSEIVKMKTMEVKRGFSFYDFVTSTNTNILLYPDKESTRAITQADRLKADYPIYYDMIVPKVEYALQRTVLLHELHKVGLYSENYCSLITSYGKESVLNCDSAAVIASYLCNVDLFNFMIAFYHFNADDLHFHVSNSALSRQRLKKNI